VAKAVTGKNLRTTTKHGAAIDHGDGIAFCPQPQRRRNAAKTSTNNDRMSIIVHG
jgi:hypothetical protein